MGMDYKNCKEYYDWVERNIQEDPDEEWSMEAHPVWSRYGWLLSEVERLETTLLAVTAAIEDDDEP